MILRLRGFFLLGIALACAAPACSGTKPKPAPVLSATSTAKTAASADRDTFVWLRNVDGFEAIDDEHVVLTSGTRRALVKTFGRCDGLRFAETIGVDAPLGYLDRSGVGSLVYRRGFGGAARCPIDRVVAVKDTKEARELVAKESSDKQ